MIAFTRCFKLHGYSDARLYASVHVELSSVEHETYFFFFFVLLFVISTSVLVYGQPASSPYREFSESMHVLFVIERVLITLYTAKWYNTYYTCNVIQCIYSVRECLFVQHSLLEPIPFARLPDRTTPKINWQPRLSSA